MSSHSLSIPRPLTSTAIDNCRLQRRNLALDVVFFREKDKRYHFDVLPKCSAVSKPRTKGYDVLHNGLPVLKWQEIIEDEDIEVESFDEISKPNDIDKRVDNIKSLLETMNDGEISISAYDTAWVALIEKDVGEANGAVREPMFPESLQWIVDNQLTDGSWGDSQIFSVYDRIINTIACVVALKFWNIHPHKCEKGMRFFMDNLCKLENENAEHMPIGFEVAFPSILEVAKSLELEIPDNSPALKEIYAKRNLKLSRIPMDILHKVPTTLLHSLEGMGGLEWEKLLKLQCPEGSMLFSPASTAYALMQTRDTNCFDYLKKAVDRFNGGVPNVYPVDLFEHIWVVDRLQRLGISRYFKENIVESMNYVHRYWTDKGICWARNSPISDLDDTAMGFRLLRLHGHHVSADVFENFRNGSKFQTFAGQSTEAVTGMYNLYRASELRFPGESTLDDGRKHALSFLTQRRVANELLDKWIITKDLPGEVEYALDIPWYASLPRLETRFYIEQYGGDDDVWIGKTLYRMPIVNNNDYLELAKIDYNACQALHLSEWESMQRWYLENEIEDFGINTEALLHAYFVAAASIFEPERARERLAWAKTLVLVETINTFFGAQSASSSHQRRAFIREFKSTSRARGYINGRRWVPNRGGQGLIKTLLGTLNQLSLDALVAHGQDIYAALCESWEKWLMAWGEEGDKYNGLAELLVQVISLSGGRCSPDKLLSIPSYPDLANLSNRLGCLLGRLKSQQENGRNCGNISNIKDDNIVPAMKELVQMVLEGSTDRTIRDAKETFLTVVKSLYYSAVCDTETVEFHIAKVLFEKVY